jgi:hypothetical protein
VIREWLCTALVEGVAWQAGIMHGLFSFLSGCWRVSPPALPLWLLSMTPITRGPRMGVEYRACREDANTTLEGFQKAQGSQRWERSVCWDCGRAANARSVCVCRGNPAGEDHP